MLEPVGIPFKGIAPGMVQDPVKQSGSEHRITHHLRPVDDLLVGGEQDGGGFIDIAYDGEEPVGLAPCDGRISDFIDDDQLGFPEVPKPEPCGALVFSAHFICLKVLLLILSSAAGFYKRLIG